MKRHDKSGESRIYTESQLKRINPKKLVDMREKSRSLSNELHFTTDKKDRARLNKRISSLNHVVNTILSDGDLPQYREYMSRGSKVKERNSILNIPKSKTSNNKKSIKKKYTNKEKSAYYSKRVNNPKLTKRQRAFAKRKVSILFN